MGLSSTKINKNIANLCDLFLDQGTPAQWLSLLLVMVRAISLQHMVRAISLLGQVISVIRQNLITTIQKLIKFCETSIGDFLFFNVPGANISQHVDEFTLKQRYKNSNTIQGSYSNHNFLITCSGLEFLCANFNIYERFMINDKSLQACYVCCTHIWHGWMFHWAQWWFGEVYEVIW